MSGLSVGHIWAVLTLKGNPRAPDQTQHLGRTQLANPRPWESALVSLSLGLGRELGHFRCYLNRSTTMCAQTRREHRCNLISRSISSTEGGITLLKASPRTQQGIFFNFQIVRTIITVVVFPKQHPGSKSRHFHPKCWTTLCGKQMWFEKRRAA